METIISRESRVESRQSEDQTKETLADSGFFWREKNGVKILVCRRLEEKGFANGFSTRLGGVSPFPENSLNLSGVDIDSAENLAENRKRFLEIFGGDYWLASSWQTHSADVRIVNNLDDAENGIQKSDALISNLENVLVGVKTADCVPILFGDNRTKAFAAVHAGWRGTANSIVVKTIEKMREIYGTNTEDLICAIGPAASGKNYEVGQDIINAFEKNFSTCGNLFTKTREGHALVDLHLANKEQISSIGVLPENIFIAPLCTIERTDLFFSYRVEKNLYGKTGRLLSVIGLKKSRQ
ncbi:MAG: peptidoglycan editing factor PgeF [Acidobacteria bacterium]|jgi:YfiH family protein|nr:peptidoglycan editing factor PgeF [Acidobacteriota bacterium]